MKGYSFWKLICNQYGSIGFGTNRFARLMDENGEGGTGGGGAGGEGEGTGAQNEADKNKGGTGEAGTGAQNKLEDLPGWAQKEIKDLRAEAAKNRTTNKTLSDRLDKMEKGFKSVFGEEDDKSTPEEKVKGLSAEKEALEVKTALLEIAVEHGVPKEKMKYFTFLMNEGIESLGDGEEMSDEALEAILEQVKGTPGASNNGEGSTKGTTSVSTGQGGKTPKKTDEITVEQFKKMGLTEKSKLYREKPEVYKELWEKSGGF